jgi:hypothetical protein
VRATHPLWSSRAPGAAADRPPDPPRTARALTRGLPAPRGKGPRRTALPCRGSRRTRASRRAKATMLVHAARAPLSAATYRYLRLLGYVAVAAVVTATLRGRASTLSFLRISPTGIGTRLPRKGTRTPSPGQE